MTIAIHVHKAARTFTARLLRLRDRVAVFDEAPFKESDHPRATSGKHPGQFVKAGTGGGGGSAPGVTLHEPLPSSKVKNDVAQTLKAHGLKKSKEVTPGGHPIFEGAGHKVYVGGHKQGSTVMYAWRHSPSGQAGHGAEALNSHLASLKGVEAPKVEAIEKGKQPKTKAAPKAAPSTGTGHYEAANYAFGNITGHTEFGAAKWQGGSADRYVWHNENGQFNGSLVVGTSEANKDQWQIFTGGKPVATGTGVESLKEAWAKHGAAVAGKEEPKPAATSAGVGVPIHAKIASGPIQISSDTEKYTTTNNTTMYISPKAGHWAISNNTTGEGSSGKGQEDLDKALAEIDVEKHIGGLSLPKGAESLDVEDDDEEGTIIHTISTGEVVNLHPNGSWLIETVGGEVLKSGDGQEALNAAFEALHPRDKSGHFIKKSGAGEPLPPTTSIEQQAQQAHVVYYNKLTSLGYKPVYETGTNWITYHAPNDSLLPSIHISKIAIGVEGKKNFQWATNGKQGSGLEKLVPHLPKEPVGSPQPATVPPPPKAPPVASTPLNLSALKQVGPQKGSNPGGQYEDANGTKFYVKKLQSQAHVDNEILAATLYAATGGDTFHYHKVDSPGETAIATTMQPLKADNVSQLTSAQKTEAQKYFAVQAWLANWDAAGTGGDNIGVNNEGKVMPLDFGGSLLYRAKGGPKGSLFNNNADEWESLRTSSKNPDAVKLYGSMTPEQLKESVKLLENISPAKIHELVQQHGPGSVTDKTNLAAVLIARRNAILAKANQKAPPAPPPPIDADALRKKIATWNPPGKPTSAIQNYKGNGYTPMNTLMRYFSVDDDDSSDAKQCVQITDWLKKASTKEDLVMYRGIPPSEYTSKLIAMAKVGRSTHEHGFSSMATSKEFSRSWSHNDTNSILYTIKIPKGSQIGTVRNPSEEDSEYEALAQRGTRFKITKIIGNVGHGAYEIEVELDQSHLGKEF